MRQSNILPSSQKITKPNQTKASQKTVIKNQDLEIDQSPKGQGYDTYTPEERKKIMKQFKEKLALFNNQELHYESDDTCDEVPDWSKDIEKVNPKIFNEWILQIISQYRPQSNLKDTKTLKNFRRKIKIWFEKEGSPDNRGDPLIPQSEIPYFKQELMKAMETMKVRHFPDLQDLMKSVISNIRSRNKKQYEDNMFSTKFWSTFKNKPENELIKEKWNSLPDRKGKVLRNREKNVEMNDALFTKHKEEEDTEFSAERKMDKDWDFSFGHNEGEDAKILENDLNLSRGDENKTESCCRDVTQNQTKIDQKMPNENQYGDYNDEPQNENEKVLIPEDEIGFYWVNKRENSIPLFNQSFGEYDCIPRSPGFWSEQEENLEEDRLQERRLEYDFDFSKFVKDYRPDNQKQFADLKETQNFSTDISSSHNGVPGGIFYSLFSPESRGYTFPREEY